MMFRANAVGSAVALAFLGSFLQISPTSGQCTGAVSSSSPSALQGSCVFTGDGAFTVPSGISSFSLTCTSGQGGTNPDTTTAGGLWSSVTLQITGVTAGLEIDFAIGKRGGDPVRGSSGKGGIGGASTYAPGGNGAGFFFSSPAGGGATAAFIGGSGSPFLVLGGGQ